jgi:predicted enzyme related to lactoylglutathione lyase
MILLLWYIPLIYTCLGKTARTISRQGFEHIAFHVENVEELLDCFIKHGGTLFGEVVKKRYPELGLLTVAYAKDPEGNFVEIQNWKR